MRRNRRNKSKVENAKDVFDKCAKALIAMANGLSNHIQITAFPKKGSEDAYATLHIGSCLLRDWTPFELTSCKFKKIGTDLGEAGDSCYVNSRYQVLVQIAPELIDDAPPVLWLSIRSNDRNEIPNDWRDFQRIKNELAGHDCEAMQIYPKDSRLVDASNQYHLWVWPPKMVIPVGYPERDVIESQEELEKQGFTKAVQRDFEPHHRSNDCLSIGPAWSPYIDILKKKGYWEA